MSLTYEEIERLLANYLDPVLSSRRTASGPARGLIPLPLDQQKFALHWADVIRKSNAEMSFQFVSQVPLALKLMGLDGTREWLLNAMDIYDREGLYPGSAALEKMEVFAKEYRLSHISVSLDEIKPVLEKFICGLAGRRLKLEVGRETFTDTETLYLPKAINRFNDKQKNYQLFKVIAVHLWAQTWFGTFKRRSPDAPHLKEILGDFADNGRALRLFNLLETIRLNACIERELPGLAREMYHLDTPTPPQDETWQYFVERLQMVKASVVDTVHATTELYSLQMPWPDSMIYQGGFDLDAAVVTIENRIQLEKSDLQKGLADLLEEHLENKDGEPMGDDGDLSLSVNETDDGELQVSLDGQPLSTPDKLEELLSSMLQDLDGLPDDWFSAQGDDGYSEKSGPDPSEGPGNGSATREGALFYDEWDFRRQTYRKNWCVLRELTTHPIHDDFPEKTLQKYPHLVAEIRKHFEALRGEDKVLKAQPAGDNIDLDALITAYADMHTGVEMTDRLFTLMNKIDRDLAVIFMIDVSGSTKGWINDAERESLILLCQALEILGDQYAIYGFSGMTRNRCEVYKVKTFSQPYDQEVRARISGLRPQDYTRMGVTIRHLTQILNNVDAQTRILITLSDGKPDDYDGYRGEYGIEDTRQALLEARNTGIHPFCITIDTEAGDYLPHMYGPASYVVVDEVRKLPLKVADIYRKLTT